MSNNTQSRKGKTIADNLVEQLEQSIKHVTGKSKSTAKAAKAAPAPAPEPVKRTHAPRGQGYANHDFERRSDEFPCKGCDEPWLHAKGFCSKCYNAARKPMKAGKTGAALRAAVRKARSLPDVPAPTAAKRASKPPKTATTAKSAKKEVAQVA